VEDVDGGGLSTSTKVAFERGRERVRSMAGNQRGGVGADWALSGSADGSVDGSSTPLQDALSAGLSDDDDGFYSPPGSVIMMILTSAGLSDGDDDDDDDGFYCQSFWL
jgi:hypothetical protein